MIEATVVFKDGKKEEKAFPTASAYYKYIDRNRKIIKYTESENLHPTQKEQGLVNV
jgi:hypothetical protein